MHVGMYTLIHSLEGSSVEMRAKLPFRHTALVLL